VRQEQTKERVVKRNEAQKEEGEVGKKMVWTKT
jgi:hypothetical protein